MPLPEADPRATVREMARHLPPSRSTLRLLEVSTDSSRTAEVSGLNAAQYVIQLRPDVHVTPYILGESLDALRLPGVSDSFDAIMGSDLLTHLPNFDATFGTFLAEALRVLRPGGRLILFESRHQNTSHNAETLAQYLAANGFARVLGETLDGSILGRGEKPYPNLTPLERTAIIAHLDDPLTTPDHDLLPIDPATGLEQVRGQALFLLIAQTPNKPVWALTPDQVLIWGAATVLDQISGQPTALVFTSLPKAVAFMQPAVRDNVIIGVNKVAKYAKTAAARWDFPILLNPTLEALQSAKRYRLPGPLIAVDPAAAVRGEE